MEFRDLIEALTTADTLAARQWVADAQRANVRWTDVPHPGDLAADWLAVAAGVVEMLAARAGQPSPAWSAQVAAAPRTVFLVRSAETMPRLRKLCEEQGPEPLRRRRILAPPDFLTAA